MVLRGKNVIVAISGSIAAYKSAILVRQLIKSGARVRVVMSESSKDFVSPLTLSTLSKYPVYSDFNSNKETGEWINHVELGLWADAMVVAPATANTLSKMRSGESDNFLIAAYLSARCPVFFAPAMDLDMYNHQSTRENIDWLVANGNIFIAPGNGELASGLVGEGRMAEPEEIVSSLERFFQRNLPLSGKKVLITAGPTREKIDPVRFISNRSTGKMGFALAEEALRKGAQVTVVCGPNSIVNSDSIERINVVSAQEMFDQVWAKYSWADVVIMTAAVADYRPASISDQKIKKTGGPLEIKFVRTVDILGELGKSKQKQLLIGFAVESENELENAKSKLKRKNLDLIVLNSLNDSGAAFEGDTNKVSIIDKNNKIEHKQLKSKVEVAADIIDKIVTLL